MKRPLSPLPPDVVGAKRLLAANTRRIRASMRMTQLAASERAGIDIRAWQKLEHEEGNVTITKIARVAAALEVPISDLLAPDGSGWAELDQVEPLRALRERAGLSLTEAAPLAGLRGPSSVQGNERLEGRDGSSSRIGTLARRADAWGYEIRIQVRKKKGR